MAERRRAWCDSDEMVARAEGATKLVRRAGMLMCVKEYELIGRGDASSDEHLRVMEMKTKVGLFGLDAMRRLMDGTLDEHVCRTLVELSMLDWNVWGLLERRGRFEKGERRGADIVWFLIECGVVCSGGVRPAVRGDLATAGGIVEEADRVMTFYGI